MLPEDSSFFADGDQPEDPMAAMLKNMGGMNSSKLGGSSKQKDKKRRAKQLAATAEKQAKCAPEPSSLSSSSLFPYSFAPLPFL